jgi:two-component system, NtrC family, sensor kinase
VSELEEKYTALQKRVEMLTEQLVHSEKLASIGQLAAGVAHEINNPIGYIASNLTVLDEYSKALLLLIARMSEFIDSEKLDDLKSQTDYDYICEDMPTLISQSEEGLERVIDIVRQLKDFSHLDEAEFVYADLHLGIQSTLNIVANELKYKADVKKVFSTLPLVYCIPSQIKQVLLNLLVNSAQAIEKNGLITITTGCDDHWVWFSVADNGSGIAPESLEQIFQPFYTTKPRGQGTGLGLALSKTIVDKHAGQMNVTSELGKGCCFTIKLPVRTASN